jgi:hypothetical protein
MNQDQVIWLRLSFTGFGSGFDWIAVVAFIAFGVVYTVVPVIGYESRRRGGLVIAMYALIGYAAVSLLQMMMQWLQIVEIVRPGDFGRGVAPLGDGPGQVDLKYLFTFNVMRMGLFLLAMIAFMLGVRSLRLRPPPLERDIGRDER